MVFVPVFLNPTLLCNSGSPRNPKFIELGLDGAVHIVFAEIVRDADGILDRVGVGAAMTHDGDAFDSQQRRSTIFRIIEPAPERAKCFFGEDVSDFRRKRLFQFLAKHGGECFDQAFT